MALIKAHRLKGNGSEEIGTVIGIRLYRDDYRPTTILEHVSCAIFLVKGGFDGMLKIFQSY